MAEPRPFEPPPFEPPPFEPLPFEPPSFEVRPFEALPSQVDLPALDRGIIAWWGEHDVFARSLAQSADGPPWTFYEGPPTANGAPGTHHVEARAFKDLFPRYRTMRGYSVPRMAGWDCHGLPVELAVEKELGLTGKQDIEKLGVAQFNARCRESVLRHVGEFEALTERMGYWIDLAHPYQTMSPEYVDSVWWALAKIHADGLLTQDYRVAPYCPRDGTTLSDHEVAQGYETVTDPSVYVRLPLREELGGRSGVDLLVWTTTPWTLVSNTAVAVNPAVTYAVVRAAAGTFVVAQPLVGAVLGGDAEVLETLPGTELVGLSYERPFGFVDIPDGHRILAAAFVTVTDGTGLVHLAPAFGVEDLAVCRTNALPVVNPIGTDGRFLDGVELVGGVFFKDADAILVRELERSGRLLRAQPYEHPYPHCWRCHTPLMYYAQQSWYIRTTAIADALHRENEATHWFPQHIKHGRYGDWLDNNVDWALSRSRYWGTPLPLWVCADGHVTAVGSRRELGRLAGSDLSTLDPHRPYVDEITFDCPTCAAPATRVPEVIDAWFDSGCMPFAALGYPHRPGSVEAFERAYPAQYICEAIDQTRGWFYTMMAVGTLVFDRSSYENVVCLGHILAEDGRKMSTHLGNILAPMPLMDAHGADALRWFMACSGSPWSPRRVGPAVLDEITRKVLLTYWNTAAFFTLYASSAPWGELGGATPVADRPVLDRWISSATSSLVEAVTECLDTYDTAGAGRRLAEFLDDLSNWYVRRSRARFWRGDADALHTLYETLDSVTRLLAPIVPFVTEEVWQRVIRVGASDAAESVHLAAWPTAGYREPDLEGQVVVARALAEAGRSARRTASLRVRQPLARAFVGLPAGVRLAPELVADVADELNVKEIAELVAAADLVDVSVKANFRTLGRRFGNRTQIVAAAVHAADAAAIVAALRGVGEAEVRVEGEAVTLGPDDVVVQETPRLGWVVETVRGVTLALDTALTGELLAEGVARDAVRLIQQARREAGFDIGDRIRTRITVDAAGRDAIVAHRELIEAETLSVAMLIDDLTADAATGPAVTLVGDGVAVAIEVERA